MEALDEVNYLLMNHQESEPIFYKDKWLARKHAKAFASLFDGLLENDLFDAIVVGAKVSDREEWMEEFEDETNATVRMPDDLPLDAAQLSGVTVAYTENRYEYGMESVLLRLIAALVLGTGLPMDHGWIVQNTETLYNIYRIVTDEIPVTRKYVHVDGETPRHRFLKVPIGTPTMILLEAADLEEDNLDYDRLLADGGPGWCFEIDDPPARFGVRKRTNSILVLNRDIADAHTFGDERINVLHVRKWDRPHETKPTQLLTPEYVRIPRITNASLYGVVFPSDPIVKPGDSVEKGQLIAKPSERGFSNAQHASIDGTVTSITDTHLSIRAT